ncbi:MAG: dTDP-4-dehydrorhamnose reductase [Lachnospiraceae bacterium]
MKVLVTGANGQLGYDLIRELEKRGHEAVGVDIREMDITDKASVDKVIGGEKPDAVIHCAAWTAVDIAEDEENREKVRLINAVGTENVAAACKMVDAKMIYISTDYVFDGEGTTPWEPDEPDRKPLNWYGQTKYEGELAVEKLLDRYFIVRIAWVFGVNGNNFIKTMLRLGKDRDKLTVVNDQTGSPTYTFDLARLLVDMAETEKYGRYHATNEGLCTWYEFACEIFRQAAEMGYSEYAPENLSVAPVSSAEYPSKAKRPSNSRMNKDKLTEAGFQRLPSWQDALQRYLKEIL